MATAVESPPTETYAFRCRNCNTLEGTDNVGENTVPHACRNCGKGVHFVLNEAGIPEKKFDPDNWIVLAELPADELAPILEYHALEPEQIVAHTGTLAPVSGQFVAVEASEGIATEDTAGVA